MPETWLPQTLIRVCKRRAFASAAVDRATIDDINILQAAMLAMERAVAGLRAPPDFVLVVSAPGHCCLFCLLVLLVSEPGPSLAGVQSAAAGM